MISMIQATCGRSRTKFKLHRQNSKVYLFEFENISEIFIRESQNDKPIYQDRMLWRKTGRVFFLIRKEFFSEQKDLKRKFCGGLVEGLVLAFGFTFWGLLSNWTIRDFDVERAVFKPSLMQHAQLITFHSDALTWFLQMNTYNRRSGVQYMRFVWIETFQCFGNYWVELHNSQVRLKRGALK